jgi:hypothetical protein
LIFVCPAVACAESIVANLKHNFEFELVICNLSIIFFLDPNNAAMLLPIPGPPGNLPSPWKVLHRGVHDGQVTLLEYQFRPGAHPDSCHVAGIQHHLTIRVSEQNLNDGEQTIAKTYYNEGCACYGHKCSVFWNWRGPPADPRPSCRFKPYA